MKRAILILFLLIFPFVLSQQPPHLIIGKILCENPSNVNITFINERTNDKIYAESSNDGNYSIVLNDFPHGWKNGDVIKVIAKKDEMTGEATIKINASLPFQWLNISLSHPSPNPPPPPPPPSPHLGVMILSPSNNSHVSNEVTIRGKAWGGNQIEVEIKVDKLSWMKANGTQNWSYNLHLKKGWHVIEARAYDGHNYSSISYIKIYVEEKKSGNEFLLLTALLIVILFIKKYKK